MGTINLQNPKLREYIRRTLEIERYGEPFSALLEEVFVREVYVLDLTPVELYEDLINFKNSVKFFSYGKCPDGAMGVTYPSTGEIRFSLDYWQNVINKNPPEIYCKKFFETFAHESLHGMQNIITANGVENRAGGYNSNIQNRAHAIYEICTQGTAAKMAYDRNLNEFNNNIVLTGDGYSNEIFAVPLIASTFGVSEKEVLKYGVRNRDELITALDKNIGNKQITANLVANIENQLEYLHSIHYPDSNQKEFSNMSQEQKKKESTTVILNLVKICQEALATRIKNTPLEFDKNTAIQYKYDQKKMLDTLRYEFQTYSWNFEKDYYQFSQASEMGANAFYIREALNVFSQIGKDNSGILQKNAPNLITAVREENFDYCEDMGIQLVSNLTFSLVDRAYDFREKKASEDYNGFNNWDNTTIFKSIYPSMNIPYQEGNVQNRLNHWDNLYTSEGYEKIRDLQLAVSSNKNKYGLESKGKLLDFLEASNDQMERCYSKFTRDNGARDAFKRSFRTEEDKEFLAKLIAERYVSKTFDENGQPLECATDREKTIQSIFETTISKYGKNQLVFAIAQVLTNDNYSSISGEGERLVASINGKKNIFDVVSQPLMDELLNQRRIIPEKNKALQKAIFETDLRHPGCMPNSIAFIIDTYKKTGIINPNAISSGGRAEFQKNFNSQRDMEDLIGLICNEYSTSIPMPNENQSQINQVLRQIVANDGIDYFRENMIKVILYNDYSSFSNPAQIQALNSIPLDNIIKDMSVPYVEKSKAIESLRIYVNSTRPNVVPENLSSIAREQKASGIKKITNRLIGLVKGKDKENLQGYANLYSEENDRGE